MGKILSAQGSGYFPKCIDYDPPQYSKITGSLEDIMSLYWRVKKFSVNASGVGVQDPINVSISGSLDLETIYYKNLYDQQPDITDEASLVCSYYSREHISPQRPGGIIIYYDGEPQYGMSANLGFLTVFSKPSNSTYAMRFSFLLDSFNAGINLGNTGDIAVGSWSVSLYGTSITGTLYAQGLDSGSFNVNFIGTEYWSYGGTYDTATGAPL
jgi:hypothetical protein